MIRSLEQDVISKLGSAPCIESVPQCVSELVLNSLDAEATEISITVNLEKFCIEVVDNGKGISLSNLQFVGEKYMTTKCHSLEDLKSPVKTLGFRGESLAKIASISDKLTITTRTTESKESFIKTIETAGQWCVVENTNLSPPGTTVLVTNFLGSCPERQTLIKPISIKRARELITKLSIIHHNVRFSFRNDVTGDVFTREKHTSSTSAFLHAHKLFKWNPEGFTTMKMRENGHEVHCLIHETFDEKTKFQYYYVNGRPVFNIHWFDVFNKLFHHRNPGEKLRFPICILDVKCLYSEIDFSLKPNKTIVNFKDETFVKIKRFMEKIMHHVLGLKKAKNIEVKEHSLKILLDIFPDIREITDTTPDSVSIPEILLDRYFARKRHQSETDFFDDIISKESIQISQLIPNQPQDLICQQLKIFRDLPNRMEIVLRQLLANNTRNHPNNNNTQICQKRRISDESVDEDVIPRKIIKIENLDEGNQSLQENNSAAGDNFCQQCQSLLAPLEKPQNPPEIVSFGVQTSLVKTE